MAGQGVDAAYIEDLYEQWQGDPNSVPESWQYFFQGLSFAGTRKAPSEDCSLHARGARMQSNVASLIYAYRDQGHVIAQTDPLGSSPQEIDALRLENWDFTDDDLREVFDTGHLAGVPERLTLREILQVLQQTYCRSIGVEYLHIQDRSIRRWLQEQLEPVRCSPDCSREQKLQILEDLVDAEQFESFTHSRYPGQKRFSLEGAETLIPGLRGLIEGAASSGAKEIVFGMSHRGRLNVLANILGQSYEEVFTEFEGNFLPSTFQGDGDVKYHKGYGSTYTTHAGQEVHLTLTANPSHLEIVDPVVQGRVRAKQRQHDDTHERKKVIPLLIHGDAAFSGQGVVAETLNLSQLAGYRTGGTVHVIINNQIGFTTSPMDGRSSPYPTDVAKLVDAPIFHVNGDDPEATVFAMEVALAFRQRFNRDVVVDMVCYRRHGHNESEDPALTQPLLYAKIKDRPTVRLQYMWRLVEEGQLTEAEADQQVEVFRERLEKAREIARKENPPLKLQAFEGRWKGLDAVFSHEPVKTSVTPELLEQVAATLAKVPEGFNLSPKVARQLPKRLAAVQQGEGGIDWGYAELLALGTLLAEDTPVRLSGQDSQRGTFSQRHAVWQDMKRGEMHIPLNFVSEDQARFCVYNSSLSEAAVLGFEYGYSLSEPEMLILWEAQFGDFVNGAQVVIDQFIVSAESKWGRDSGIVLLLPHGFEGQGPEHSNAYMERFLAAGAQFNIQVCNLTTPAQYFHLLRRQTKRRFRMPLVLMAPKSMLRHKRAVSRLADFVETPHFEEVLADDEPPKRARRLVLCSGKFYWDLVVKRRKENIEDVAIVRLEQLFPLHEEKLREVVARYGEVEEVVWAQEEPQNRGPWTYLFPQLLTLFPDYYARGALRYVGRPASASPATGSLRRHRQEQDYLVTQALEGRGSKGQQ
ncbi:MAG: 2-oxoglutarate dehydrogenase E1 component [Deltaproteobacteria bacterium]|nr:2-oxoglutarate dehydrogenase E1 component [Deltaproteobacteria bacterium]